jgi:hypothetical protein
MPPAFETAAARGAPDVLAMPASKMGYLMPSKVHRGVWIAGGEDMMRDQTESVVFGRRRKREKEEKEDYAVKDSNPGSVVIARKGQTYGNAPALAKVWRSWLTAAMDLGEAEAQVRRSAAFYDLCILEFSARQNGG